MDRRREEKDRFLADMKSKADIKRRTEKKATKAEKKLA